MAVGAGLSSGGAARPTRKHPAIPSLALVTVCLIVLLSPLAFTATPTRDGPAELPRVVPSSAYPEDRYGRCAYAGPSQPKAEDSCGFKTYHLTRTGSPARDGESLQAALDNAGGAIACGAKGLVIAVPPGEFDRVHWVLGHHSGSCQGKWVILRTDVADSQLPPAGARINPSYAGVMPEMVGQSRPNAIVSNRAAAPGQEADHWWLGPGLNVTFRSGGANWIVIQLGGNGEVNASLLPDSIVIDRCWVHGSNATDDTHAGISMDARNAVLVNSWIDDIHNVNFDSMTFLAYTSPGPFLVDNNHLEGATAEGFIFGGADGQTGVIPSDITITHNHIIKPTEYWQGSSRYNGVRSVVKNGFEFKFGQRALVEGNVIDNVWCCFTQYGWAFLLTPKNNNGTPPGNANAVLQDVTVRYNLFRHTLGGFQMAPTVPYYGGGYPTHGLRRISIHDNIFSDISGRYSQRGLGTNSDGTGYQWQMTTAADLLQSIGCSSGSQGCVTAAFDGFPLTTSSTDSVTIDHNTFARGEVSTYGTAAVLSSNTFWPVTNWQFSNNIIWYSALPGVQPHGIVASAPGTGDSCVAIETMSPGGTWKGNVFVGVPDPACYGSSCALPYPAQAALTVSRGGSIAPNTTVFVRISYVKGKAESRGSNEISGTLWLGSWQPSTSYSTRQAYGQDPAGNLIALYSPGVSGHSASVFPTSGPPDQMVHDGSVVWVSKYIGGTLGTLVTPSDGGPYEVKVSLPIIDKGPESGWRIYASTSPKNERRQAVCGDDGSSVGAIPISTVSCRLTSIDTSGHPVPDRPSGTISNDNISWACWPGGFDGSKSIGFEDFEHGIYKLRSNSPCKGQGTDGSDPGADYDLVMSRIRTALDGERR